MEPGRAAAAQWLLGKSLDPAATTAAMNWLFAKRPDDDGQWLADAHAQFMMDKYEPKPVGPREMMGAYGDLGNQWFLLGDEEPKNASAQKVEAWRTRNEQEFWRLLDEHPPFAKSLAQYLYHVSTTSVLTQCFRRRFDGDDLWRWMWRIQWYLRKTSDQSSKRKFQPGKRKRSPA